MEHDGATKNPVPAVHHVKLGLLIFTTLSLTRETTSAKSVAAAGVPGGPCGPPGPT